ncbi:Succinate receptor 1 G-protein coupled receptor 91 [Triplophysa tibetana]|uniref:Succinate receptor 1 G-protein coupled receptor 91 n=1 Tax=Triplophysa tibetana TaxID=1572043 RepID=A0A5A9PSP8_9TELE|nr:Succinate receptor 1 G-protein coupled receptor 91 [Triplophysa tibetana]
MDANKTIDTPSMFNVFCIINDKGDEVMRFVLICLMPGFFVAVLTVGLPLNSLSCWLYFRRPRPWTRSTLFLHNLALADMSWLLALPFLIQYHVAGMRWSLGSTFCWVVRLLYHNYFYHSIFFVTCLSFDRYLAIVHPHRSSVLLSRQRALVVSLAVWAIIALMSYPVAYMSTTVPCLQHNWTSVYRLRRLSDPRLQALAVDLAGAMVLFGVFYLPYHLSRNAAVVMRALKIDNPSAWYPADLLFTIDMCICSLSSCINPLLGFLMGGTFRQGLREVFSEIWRLRPRVRPEGTGERRLGDTTH